jgi:hypothetical protein
VKATELKGQLDQQLPWVRVTALKAKRYLLVRPTTAADLRKKKVTWREGKAYFVASDVLIDAGFPVETGYKKRYEVHLIQSAKKGPTVVNDMRGAPGYTGPAQAQGQVDQGRLTKGEAAAPPGNCRLIHIDTIYLLRMLRLY